MHVDQAGHTDPQGLSEGAEQLGAPSSYTQTTDLRPPGGQWVPESSLDGEPSAEGSLHSTVKKTAKPRISTSWHLRGTECRCTPGYSRWARTCREVSAGRLVSLGRRTLRPGQRGPSPLPMAPGYMAGIHRNTKWQLK